MTHPRLTTRQLQVLRAIESSPDWSTDIAAHRLGISRDGVFYHIRRARAKCGKCSNHYQLIAYHVVGCPSPRRCKDAPPGQMELPAA